MKWIALALVAACASSPPRPEFPAPEDAEATARRPPPPRGEGVTRAELTRTLDAGPGAFLASVHVRVARDDGGFRGWEIVALDPPYTGAGLAPGDVVTRVNGRVIERPEQLGDAWGALRGATAIVVEYLRAGERHELRVPVIESAP